MKKTGFFLSLLLLAGSVCPVAQATPASATSTLVKSDLNEQYENGKQDGLEAAAGYAAEYGYGTQAYRNVITAAAADARYQALHSEGDLSAYFQGYGVGLRSY